MKQCIFLSLLLSIISTVASANIMYSASGAVIPQTTTPTYDADKWYHDSAERDAIYREVFLWAEMDIKQKVAAEGLKPHQWGIVLDIDETILDNSQWNYLQDVHGDKESWLTFAAKAISTPTPSAIEFLDAIHKMGGYINLVSNRPTTLQSSTEKNLRDQHLYFDQALLDTTNQGTSFVDKNARFTAIIEGTNPSKLPQQKIIAWLGDNIQDFPKLKQIVMVKENVNGPAYKQFGTSFFALPNPMYGSWEANRYN